MAKRKGKSGYGGRGGRGGKGGSAAAIVALAIVLVLAAAAFCVWYFWDDIRGLFGGGAEISVTLNGKTYEADSKGLVIYSGDKLTLTCDDPSAVELTVTAAEEKDFSYTVGEEPYRFRDVAGKDFSAGFETELKDGELTITYGTLQEILTKVHGHEAAVDMSQDLTGDLFILTIRCGKAELKLSFGVGLPIGGLELVPDHLIFGGIS